MIGGATLPHIPEWRKPHERKGWIKQKQPRKDDNTKYTGEEFCIFIAREKRRYVVNVGGNHTVAIVNKKIYDTWDSTEGCVGNYWFKV